MEPRFYTYMLVDPRTNLPFYIGKGTGDRIKKHLYEARNSDKNSKKLAKIRKIESLGLAVICTKVDENISDEQAKEFEIFLIQECRDLEIDLCNMTAGGDGSIGCLQTEETKLKKSQALKGKKKNFSEEYINQLREKVTTDPRFTTKRTGEDHWAYGLTGEANPNFGRKDTPEQIEAKRRRAIGTKRGPTSEELKQKISEATTGVKKSTTANMRKPKRKIKCPHCGIETSGGNIKRWHGDKCKMNTNKGEANDVSE